MLYRYVICSDLMTTRREVFPLRALLDVDHNHVCGITIYIYA